MRFWGFFFGIEFVKTRILEFRNSDHSLENA